MFPVAKEAPNESAVAAIIVSASATGVPLRSCYALSLPKMRIVSVSGW